jgi:hypothetical protein
MAVTPDYVREVFKGLENGDGAASFTLVADDVDWTVMGTHPLAGRYRSNADFIAGTLTGSSASTGNSAPPGISCRQRRPGSGRTLFLGDGKERHEIRQSLLLDPLFRGRQDRARSSLSRLGSGRSAFQRESGCRLVHALGL